MAHPAVALVTLACGIVMREIVAQGSHPGDLVEGDRGVGDSMDVWGLWQGHLCGAEAGRVCRDGLEARVAGHVRYVCAVLVRQLGACRCAHGSVKVVLRLVHTLVVYHGVSNLILRAENHACPVHRSLYEADACLRQVVVLFVGQQRLVHALARRPATASPG